MLNDPQKFAQEWINSWNSHDLKKIIDHYSDDIEISTPMIKITLGKGYGSLKGKDKVSDYWQQALIKFPDLNFELYEVTAGVNSVAIYYKSVMNKNAIEVMFFNEIGQVNKMFAHYT